MQQVPRTPQVPAEIPPEVEQAFLLMQIPARLSAEVTHSERGIIGVIRELITFCGR